MKKQINTMPVHDALDNLSAIAAKLNNLRNNADAKASDIVSLNEDWSYAQKVMDISAVTAYIEELSNLPIVERWEKWIADGMEVTSYVITAPNNESPIYAITPRAYGVKYSHMEKLDVCPSETVLNSYLKSFLLNIAKRTCAELEQKALVVNSKQAKTLEKDGVFNATSNTKMLEQLQMIADAMKPADAASIKMLGKDFKIVEMLSRNFKMTNNSVSVDIKNVSKLKQLVMLAIYTRKTNGDYSVTCKDKLFVQE